MPSYNNIPGLGRHDKEIRNKDFIRMTEKTSILNDFYTLFKHIDPTLDSNSDISVKLRKVIFNFYDSLTYDIATGEYVFVSDENGNMVTGDNSIDTFPKKFNELYADIQELLGDYENWKKEIDTYFLSLMTNLTANVENLYKDNIYKQLIFLKRIEDYNTQDVKELTDATEDKVLLRANPDVNSFSENVTILLQDISKKYMVARIESEIDGKFILNLTIKATGVFYPMIVIFDRETISIKVEDFIFLSESKLVLDILTYKGETDLKKSVEYTITLQDRSNYNTIVEVEYSTLLGQLKDLNKIGLELNDSSKEILTSIYERHIDNTHEMGMMIKDPTYEVKNNIVGVKSATVRNKPMQVTHVSLDSKELNHYAPKYAIDTSKRENFFDYDYRYKFETVNGKITRKKRGTLSRSFVTNTIAVKGDDYKYPNTEHESVDTSLVYKGFDPNSQIAPGTFDILPIPQGIKDIYDTIPESVKKFNVTDIQENDGYLVFKDHNAHFGLSSYLVYSKAFGDTKKLIDDSNIMVDGVDGYPKIMESDNFNLNSNNEFTFTYLNKDSNTYKYSYVDADNTEKGHTFLKGTLLDQHFSVADIDYIIPCEGDNISPDSDGVDILHELTNHAISNPEGNYVNETWIRETDNNYIMNTTVRNIRDTQQFNQPETISSDEYTFSSHIIRKSTPETINNFYHGGRSLQTPYIFKESKYFEEDTVLACCKTLDGLTGNIYKITENSPNVVYSQLYLNSSKALYGSFDKLCEYKDKLFFGSSNSEGIVISSKLEDYDFTNISKGSFDFAVTSKGLFAFNSLETLDHRYYDVNRPVKFARTPFMATSIRTGLGIYKYNEETGDFDNISPNGTFTKIVEIDGNIFAFNKLDSVLYKYDPETEYFLNYYEFSSNFYINDIISTKDFGNIIVIPSISTFKDDISSTYGQENWWHNNTRSAKEFVEQYKEIDPGFHCNLVDLDTIISWVENPELKKTYIEEHPEDFRFAYNPTMWDSKVLNNDRKETTDNARDPKFFIRTNEILETESNDLIFNNTVEGTVLSNNVTYNKLFFYWYNDRLKRYFYGPQYMNTTDDTKDTASITGAYPFNVSMNNNMFELKDGLVLLGNQTFQDYDAGDSLDGFNASKWLQDTDYLSSWINTISGDKPLYDATKFKRFEQGTMFDFGDGTYFVGGDTNNKLMNVSDTKRVVYENYSYKGLNSVLNKKDVAYFGITDETDITNAGNGVYMKVGDAADATFEKLNDSYKSGYIFKSDRLGPIILSHPKDTTALNFVKPFTFETGVTSTKQFRMFTDYSDSYTDATENVLKTGIDTKLMTPESCITDYKDNTFAFIHKFNGLCKDKVSVYQLVRFNDDESLSYTVVEFDNGINEFVIGDLTTLTSEELTELGEAYMIGDINSFGFHLYEYGMFFNINDKIFRFNEIVKNWNNLSSIFDFRFWSKSSLETLKTSATEDNLTELNKSLTNNVLESYNPVFVNSNKSKRIDVNEDEFNKDYILDNFFYPSQFEADVDTGWETVSICNNIPESNIAYIVKSKNVDVNGHYKFAAIFKKSKKVKLFKLTCADFEYGSINSEGYISDIDSRSFKRNVDGFKYSYDNDKIYFYISYSKRIIPSNGGNEIYENKESVFHIMRTDIEALNDIDANIIQKIDGAMIDISEMDTIPVYDTFDAGYYNEIDSLYSKGYIFLSCVDGLVKDGVSSILMYNIETATFVAFSRIHWKNQYLLLDEYDKDNELGISVSENNIYSGMTIDERDVWDGSWTSALPLYSSSNSTSIRKFTGSEFTDVESPSGYVFLNQFFGAHNTSPVFKETRYFDVMAAVSRYCGSVTDPLENGINVTYSPFLFRNIENGKELFYNSNTIDMANSATYQEVEETGRYGTIVNMRYRDTDTVALSYLTKRKRVIKSPEIYNIIGKKQTFNTARSLYDMGNVSTTREFSNGINTFVQTFHGTDEHRTAYMIYNDYMGEFVPVDYRGNTSSDILSNSIDDFGFLGINETNLGIFADNNNSVQFSKFNGYNFNKKLSNSLVTFENAIHLSSLGVWAGGKNMLDTSSLNSRYSYSSITRRADDDESNVCLKYDRNTFDSKIFTIPTSYKLHLTKRFGILLSSNGLDGNDHLVKLNDNNTTTRVDNFTNDYPISDISETANGDLFLYPIDQRQREAIYYLPHDSNVPRLVLNNETRTANMSKFYETNKTKIHDNYSFDEIYDTLYKLDLPVDTQLHTTGFIIYNGTQVKISAIELISPKSTNGYRKGITFIVDKTTRVPYGGEIYGSIIDFSNDKFTLGHISRNNNTLEYSIPDDFITNISKMSLTIAFEGFRTDLLNAAVEEDSNFYDDSLANTDRNRYMVVDNSLVFIEDPDTLVPGYIVFEGRLYINGKIEPGYSIYSDVTAENEEYYSDTKFEYIEGFYISEKTGDLYYDMKLFTGIYNGDVYYNGKLED